MANDTQSILDSMTAGILDRKAGKPSGKATLTPVSGEVAPLSGHHATNFPYDQPDVVLNALRQAQEHIRVVSEGILALTALYGGVPVAVGDPVMDVKAKERAADAAHAARQAKVDLPELIGERLDRLSAEAQAKVFGDKPPTYEGAARGSTAPGWECPTHGAAATTDATSKRGRKYRVCGTCSEFER